MARPRTVDDEAILDAALALTHRLGPARLTFAALGAEVGLSAATLVQRFGSKRGLLLAAARRAVTHWTAAFEAPVTGSPLDALADAMVAAAGDVQSPGELAGGLAFLEMDFADPEFGAIARAGAIAVHARLERLLTAAVDAGELRPGTDVAALATLMETVYHGATIRWALHREGALAAAMRAQTGAALAPYRVEP